MTINKIEFQDIGKSGKLVVTEIPTFSSPAKPAFFWSNVTTGTVTSTITSGNTVTGTVAQIGDTFLMLPTDNFSSAAKIVITTNWGTNEFNLREVVAASALAPFDIPNYMTTDDYNLVRCVYPETSSGTKYPNIQTYGNAGMLITSRDK